MDLIQSILEIFEDAMDIESETLGEGTKEKHRKELEDLFKEQDKISPEKGD